MHVLSYLCLIMFHPIYAQFLSQISEKRIAFMFTIQSHQPVKVGTVTFPLKCWTVLKKWNKLIILSINWNLKRKSLTILIFHYFMSLFLSKGSLKLKTDTKNKIHLKKYWITIHLSSLNVLLHLLLFRCNIMRKEHHLWSGTVI